MTADSSMASFFEFLVRRFDRDAPDLFRALLDKQAKHFTAETDRLIQETKKAMASTNEHIAQLTAEMTGLKDQIEAQTATLAKSYDEVTKALQEVKTTGITQEQLDAAVAAAKEGVTTEIAAQIQTAMDPLKAAITTHQEAVTKADDIVADAVVTTESVRSTSRSRLR